MIFIDSTELRDNTRLPQGVIQAGQELAGLELTTGADFLISPLTSPCIKLLSDPLTLPQRLAVKKHIRAGLLVQRKSGRDFTNSIPKLDEILGRMLQWTRRPWLLIIADLKCDSDGQCIIDGHASGWSWNMVDGALCYWQLRGGMLTVLSRETLIASWVNGWLVRLDKMQSEKFHQVNSQRIQQVLLMPDWKDTLTTFPGIGQDRAKSLAKSQGTLANCLMYLSDENSIDYAKIPGIGLKTIQQARQWMGLKDGIILSPNSNGGEQRE